MSLRISILKAPDSVVLFESTKTITTEGGTIGRGNDNLWVLEDPERYLSTHHCQFTFENGQFYITDQSTNGTYYNNSSEPMGKGTKLPVNDQDTFIVGDYEFSIQLSDDSPGFDSVDGFAPGPFATGAAEASPGLASSPFASGMVSGSDSLFGDESVEKDPLAALDKAQGGQDSLAPGLDGQPGIDPFGLPTQPDQADPLNQQIAWPNAVPDAELPASDIASTAAIPDDWDDDFLSSPPLTAETPIASKPAAPKASHPVGQSVGNASAQISNNRQQELEQENAALKAELDILRQQLVTHKNRAKADMSVDTTLIESLGFENKNLDEAQIENINQLAGEVLREMVAGLMQVLGSRSSIKNEFRMNVTTIQPVENNPLKFSANVDDAMENMFLKQGDTFKKPVEAVRDGFEGVAEHQVAVIAGIREAFRSVIERFDPVLLDERFAKQHKGSLMLGSHKAKNWESYVEYYSELVDDIDKSFQYLFGDGFVRAYEEQLQKLAISRKSKKFSR